MKCPQCGAWTTVLETRQNKTNATVRRRYECGNLHRFRTEEVVVVDDVKEREAVRLEIGRAPGTTLSVAKQYNVSIKTVQRFRAYAGAAT